MTLGTTLNTVTTEGNGATTSFTYPFLIPAAAYATVTYTDASNNQTILLPSQFSITGIGNALGGVVTYPLSGGSPIAAGTTLTIQRVLPEIQGTSVSTQGPTFASIEGALDYLTMLIQQISNTNLRAITINPADTVLPNPLPVAAVRANQLMGFDSTGQPIVAQPASALVSTAMQPVVAASSIPAAVNLLTEILPFTGATTRPVISKLSDFLAAADFGAFGDNTTDDTAALQAAFNEAATNNKILLLQGSVGTTFLISSPLQCTSNLSVIGANPYGCVITTNTNSFALLQFQSTAAGIRFENVGLETGSTLTLCATIAQGAQVIDFVNCQFFGSYPNGSMVYNQGNVVQFDNCSFLCFSTTTTGIQFDGGSSEAASLNCAIYNSRAGGPGVWLAVTNESGNPANAMQGLRLVNNVSTCTGPINLNIGGQAFLTTIVGNVIDQASNHCVVVGGGASYTQMVGNWFGLQAGASTASMLIDATAGGGTLINGNVIFGSNGSCIAVGASGATRTAGVSITSNIFLGGTIQTTMVLDSVNGCIITSNIDTNSPLNGSWNTVATFGSGAYTFANNNWSANALAAVHSGSSYRGDEDRGQTLVSRGFASTGSGTTLTVAHGCATTPTLIFLTPGSSVGTYNYLNVTSTTFEIAWGNAGAAAFSWEARVHS